MAHSRRSVLSRPSPRRQTGWSGGPASETNGAAGLTLSASGSVLGTIISVPNLDGLTIVRIRGEFVFWLITATADRDGFFGAVGIGIFNDNALTAGVASVQTPIADEGWDGWMWHRYFGCISAGQISAAGVALSGGQVGPVTHGVRVEVDSKAMRKIPTGMSLAVVLEVNEAPTATATWMFNSRVLTKLP